MTSAPLLDWMQATARRDDGMARAVEHADYVRARWSDTAMDLLLIYKATHGEFLAEDVRAFADSSAEEDQMRAIALAAIEKGEKE